MLSRNDQNPCEWIIMLSRNDQNPCFQHRPNQRIIVTALTTVTLLQWVPGESVSVFTLALRETNTSRSTRQSCKSSRLIHKKSILQLQPRNQVATPQQVQGQLDQPQQRLPCRHTSTPHTEAGASPTNYHFTPAHRALWS